MKKKKNKKTIVVFLIIIFFIVTLILSLTKIISYLKDNHENEKIREDITKNSITIIEPNIDDEEQVVKYDIDFKTLKEQNPDTVAYLKVFGTNIDYVVVKGNDNSYYLNHNFNKNYNVAGWVFADYHNKFDGTDKNIVVYGHNIKDGSMFGTLKNVLNDDWRVPDNLKVLFVTEYGTYYYQVFSTYTIEPEDYYINTIFNSDKDFESFINKIKSRSNYDYNVEVSESDKILTLSSCTTGGLKRVVLHAKRIEN